MMTKIPMTRLQPPHPSPLAYRGEGRFEYSDIDDWNLFGIWDLVIGA